MDKVGGRPETKTLVLSMTDEKIALENFLVGLFSAFKKPKAVRAIGSGLCVVRGVSCAQPPNTRSDRVLWNKIRIVIAVLCSWTLSINKLP